MPVSVPSIYYIERRNESHLLPDLSYIRDIIYFLLVNDLFLVSTMFNHKFVITYFKHNNIT